MSKTKTKPRPFFGVSAVCFLFLLPPSLPPPSQCVHSPPFSGGGGGGGGGLMGIKCEIMKPETGILPQIKKKKCPHSFSHLKNQLSLYLILLFLILWSFFGSGSVFGKFFAWHCGGKKEKEKKITSSSIPIQPSLLSVWVRLGPLVPSYNSWLFHAKVRQKKKQTKKEWEIGVSASHPCPMPIPGVACSHRRLLCLFEAALGGLGRRKNTVSPIVILAKCSVKPIPTY